METVTNDEMIKTARNTGFFFAQLKANGIPEELACLLTRDYFNYSLSQDDDGDDGERVPAFGPFGDPVRFWIRE